MSLEAPSARTRRRLIWITLLG
jgi:hypothetical protein